MGEKMKSLVRFEKPTGRTSRSQLEVGLCCPVRGTKDGHACGSLRRRLFLRHEIGHERRGCEVSRERRGPGGRKAAECGWRGWSALSGAAVAQAPRLGPRAQAHLGSLGGRAWRHSPGCGGPEGTRPESRSEGLRPRVKPGLEGEGEGKRFLLVLPPAAGHPTVAVPSCQNQSSVRGVTAPSHFPNGPSQEPTGRPGS